MEINEGNGIIPTGPFKGKKIEFAPTSGVNMFLSISEEFMKKIFDFAPGECLITDESSLHDFIGLEDMKLTDIQKKIQDVFGVDVSGIESGNLLEIFMRIHRRKYGEPS